MGKYVLRRLILTIPVVFGILLLTFAMLRLVPGDPCRAILGERATNAICDPFLERMGLNKSIMEQFVIYLTRFMRGDLDISFRHGRPVIDLIAERLPTTVELATVSLLFACAVGIPLGIISAYRRNSIFDVGTMIGANIGVSMPVFWLGLMLAYLFAVVLKDTPFALPPSGRLSAGTIPDPFFIIWGLADAEEQAGGLLVFISRLNTLNAVLTLNGSLLWDAIIHLLLPSITVGTIPLAIIARMTRSSLLDVLDQDYIRTARAKGLNEGMVVIQHGLRNAMLPVVTVIGLSFGSLISGAVLTETIFGLSGVGRMVVEGINARDYTLVQGFTVFIAVAFVLVNWFVDILYAYLDPRIRLE
jgi:peptide/nickel transport system permease protein